MPNHLDQLPAAFAAEWAAQTILPGATLEHDGTRFWWVEDETGMEVIRWECRNFPGCATLLVTTKVELREDLRGRGLGRLFRSLRHRAYKRAGFAGEIATVRSDNPAQNRLMETMNAVRMGTFPSEYGGTYCLWLTTLQAPARQPVPAAPPLPMPPLANPQRAEAAEQRYQAFAAPNPHIGSDFNAFMVSEEVGAAEAAYQAPLRAPTITPPGRRKKTFAHRGGQ